MFRLHRWLLGSGHAEGLAVGKLLVGISTIMFAVVLVVGVLLWFPRARRNFKRSLAISRKGGLAMLNGLHVAVGMYVVALLLTMALTGLNWSFQWYRTVFCTLFWAEFPEIKRIVFMIHTGAIGGLATKIIWFAAALAGASLPLTGYWLWIKRIARRRR